MVTGFILFLADYIKYRAVDEAYPTWNVVSVTLFN